MDIKNFIFLNKNNSEIDIEDENKIKLSEIITNDNKIYLRESDKQNDENSISSYSDKNDREKTITDEESDKNDNQDNQIQSEDSKNLSDEDNDSNVELENEERKEENVTKFPPKQIKEEKISFENLKSKNGQFLIDKKNNKENNQEQVKNIIENFSNTETILHSYNTEFNSEDKKIFFKNKDLF